MTKLTWLHLSDWHQKGKEFDRKVVLDGLLADIRDRAKINPDLKKIDFIVFSGDLAYSGKPEEYQAAKENLFSPLLEACGLGPEHLFIVPGNHDLDRDAFEFLPAPLMHPLLSEDEIQKWLTSEKGKDRLLEPFEAYCQFAKDYAAGTLTAYASHKNYEIDGKTVALVGFNSALMCGRNKPKGNEIDDYGKIIVGEYQIYDVIKQNEVSTADLRISVLHHPFEWLVEEDRHRVEGCLKEKFHFILCGHQHFPKVVVVTTGTEGDYVLIPAGASYDRRVPVKPCYANSFNFVHLDFVTGRGIVYLRSWSDRTNKWREDVDSHAGGKVEFSLPKEQARTEDNNKGLCNNINMPKFEREFPPWSESGSVHVTAQFDLNNPVFNIPYRSKGNGVVGRDEALQEVRRQLTEGKRTAIGHTAAFQGLGGLGKTQLAVEYATAFRDEYPKGIIWIHADQDIDAQLIRIATGAAWISPQSDHAVILDIARNRLRTFSRCLIIFDNVEDSTHIEPYLPEPDAQPHILITSRTTQRDFVPIELHLLDKDLSRELLLKESRRDENSLSEEEQSAAEQIAESLGGLPLAIEIAGAYLSHLPSCRFQDYLAILQSNIQTALRGELLSSYTRHEQDIFRTLQISGQVFTEAPLLEKILKVLAWSGSSFMGLSLMSAILGEQESALYHPLQLGISLRLLNRDKQSERYEIHRLLRRVHQMQFTLDAERDWVGDACQRLGDWFDKRRKEFTELAVFEAEIDHLKSWLIHASNYPFPQHIIRLSWLQAYPPYHWGHYREAHRLVYNAFQMVEKHPDTDVALQANVLNDLGSTYGYLGNNLEALGYLERALEIRRKLFGEEHLHTAESLNNVGNIYSELGRNRDALRYHDRALEIRRKLFGEEHPHTAQSLNSIGAIYRELGNNQKALRYHDRALGIRLKLFGEEHPDTAESLNNVGDIYSKFGKNQEALKYHERALEIRRKLFGEEHPHTAESFNDVGNIYSKFSKNQEALRYYERALGIRRKLFGEEHPSMSESFNNIGSIYNKLGKNEDALRYHMHSLEIDLKLYGKEHPRTSQSFNNIGVTYCYLNKNQDALNCFERALEIRRKLFGEEHPDTLITSRNIIQLLLTLRRYQDASNRLTHIYGNLTAGSPEYAKFDALRRRIHTESIKHGFRPPSNKKKPKIKKGRKGRK
jgi:tetratricopeptide (TPR) repeat protein/predicted MPP superfamily phosphohydrolase